MSGAWKIALASGIALLVFCRFADDLVAQVENVRFKVHWPNMPVQATSGRIHEIQIMDGSSAAMAVGWSNRTDRPGQGYSALIYDPSALITPSSTYLGSLPQTGNLWDGYDLLGPPNQWVQNWADNTIHLTYDQLILNGVNSTGLIACSLYNANASPQFIPCYLELFPSGGTLELKRIPLPGVAAGGRAMFVNEVGEILVRLRDSSNTHLGPYIFKPAQMGTDEVRTEIPYLAGITSVRGFNSLGQVISDDQGIVALHALGSGTTQQFPDYVLRTIENGATQTFSELTDPNGGVNEFGQFVATLRINKGRDKGTYAVRYGGLLAAAEERRWQPPMNTAQAVEAINDSGDALDNQGWDAYYYHEGQPSFGDETFIPSVKNLVLPETDPGDVFINDFIMDDQAISNRNSSGLGWMWGRRDNASNANVIIALLEPVIPGQTPGISTSPTENLITTETGGIDSFDVVLDSEPAANVTIGISSSNTDEGTIDQASLTFTPANWNMPQTVTVTGVDDTVEDGDVAYMIITAAAASTDPNYDGLDVDDVSVTNLDDDMPPGDGSETYDSVDTPLAIPDNAPGGVASDILAGDHLITNLTVNVNILHQRPADLVVYIIDPAGGNPVQLFNFSGDNVVADFNGESSLGLWTLEVYDTRNKKTGTLNSWSITVDY